MSSIIKSTRVKVVENYSVDILNTYGEKIVKQEDNKKVKNEVEQIKISNDEIIKNAQHEADIIIERAKSEADNILAEAADSANIQAQAILEKAQQDGYNSGYNQAMDEVAPIKAQAKKELELAKIERQEMIESVEPQMINLVIEIANSIFGTMVNLNPNTIGILIRKGLSEVNGMGEIMIHVSKDDYENAQQQKEELYESLGGNSNLEIIKDMALGKGDCIIETPFGNVDCSFDQQFESIKNELLYILENR